MPEKESLAGLEAGLSSELWTVRKETVLTAGRGEWTDTVANALWQLLNREGDNDVQAAALWVLASHRDERVWPNLLEGLASQLQPVRLASALGLMHQPDRVDSKTRATLVRLFADEQVLPLQVALGRLLFTVDAKLAQDKVASLLAGYTLSSIRGGALLSLLAAPDQDRAGLIAVLDEGAKRLGDPWEIFELDRQILACADSESNVLNEYLTREDVTDLRASFLVLWLESEYQLTSATTEDVDLIAQRLAGGLRQWRNVLSSRLDLNAFSGLGFSEELVAEAMDGAPWIAPGEPMDYPARAVDWFTTHAEELSDRGRETYISSLWNLLPDQAEIVSKLLDTLGADSFYRELGKRFADEPSAAVGRGLLIAEEGPHLEAIRAHANENVPHIAAILDQSSDGYLRGAVADWVAKRASNLSEKSVEYLHERLTRAHSTDVDSYSQNKISAALIELRSVRRQSSINPLVEQLRGPDVEIAHNALDVLDSKATSGDSKTAGEATRVIVNEWVSWLALDRKGQLVESTADRLRRNALSVLPLLNHLTTPLPLTDELQQGLREQVIPEEVGATVERLLHSSTTLTDLDRRRLVNWLKTTQAGVSRSDALIRAEELGAEQLQQIIDDEISSALRVRESEVHSRISQHLLEMSERRFFDDEGRGFEEVSTQLKLHAVPILSRLLPAEDSVEVRENVARILARIGGDASIDALARAVSGQERTRDARQKLLSTYYLEPSKEQSNEAARILTTAVSDARRTLRVLQFLNFVFASIGILALGAGFYLLLFSTTPELQFAGGAISVTAFVGLIVQMLREPLNRIQEAMNRLVQLETAFTSFIWELNLNSTFIQSQYVKNGLLTTSEISDTIERIEGAMRLSMDLVSTYADQTASTRIVPSVSSVSPGVLNSGERVRVRGAWLLGGRTNKSQHAVTVLLDHKAIDASILATTDSEIEFRATFEHLNANGDVGVHWLSLSVFGQETNALAVQVASGTPGEPNTNGLRRALSRAAHN